MFRLDVLTLFVSLVVGVVSLRPSLVKATLEPVSNAKESSLYKVDWSALEKLPAEAEMYKKTYASMQTQETREGLQILIDVVKKASESYPTWVDGNWLVALHSVTLAATYTGKKADFDKARALLKVAEKHGRMCLKLDKENAMCRYSVAVALGTRASIDGIVASLDIGKEMQDLLVAVEQSKVDFDFGSKGFLQENVLHALGMFRRLVPNSSLVKMTFGIKGNIEEALKYHEKAYGTYKLAPCSTLMTGAAEYCYGKDEDDEGKVKSGLERIEAVSKMNSHEFDENICIRDAPQILKDKSAICSYTRALLAE